MLVDADGNEWGDPIVSREGDSGTGGRKDVETTGLSADDQRYYSGQDAVYDIGAFGDRETFVLFYLPSAAGVNPGSNDPSVEFCAESRYNSNKQTDKVLVGCWTDAATQTEVATAGRLRFTFTVV